MKTAVVLSGGGAKGSYQIGVWKALLKMHIKYDIVTGTSVGALNGALMVQHSFIKALSIWKNITYKDIIGEDINATTSSDLDVYKEYAKNFIIDGGMDTTSLENLFMKNINYLRFKLSKVDYGIITFNLSTFKHKELCKKDMDKEQLKDYVIASASCYPAFKKKNINQEAYMDGGVYDNLPINLAIKMGAEKVIAVDLKAPGIKKGIINKNVDIVRIYPRNKLSSFLIFNKENSNKMIAYGYNDTMKTFNKLDGNKFTFKKGALHKNYEKYRQSIIDITKRISDTDNLLLNVIVVFNDINNILKEKDFSKLHNNIVEYLGKIYELDESVIYSMHRFNSELLYEFEENGIVTKLSEKELLDAKMVISHIYYLLNVDTLNVKKISKLMMVYKKEFMGALYLTAIENN